MNTTDPQTHEWKAPITAETPVVRQAQASTIDRNGRPFYYSNCFCGWDAWGDYELTEVEAQVDWHNGLKHDGYARVGDRVRTATGYRDYTVAAIDEHNDTVTLLSLATGRTLRNRFIDTLEIVARATVVS